MLFHKFYFDHTITTLEMVIEDMTDVCLNERTPIRCNDNSSFLQIALKDNGIEKNRKHNFFNSIVEEHDIGFGVIEPDE